MNKKNQKILIVGAGPCGLGAAYRLKELGYENFKIIEKNNYIGGISASFRDPQGFVWDQGGHVIFSHYQYFDNLLEKLLGGNYLEHMRESWIWLLDRFIPYPFQNNIRYLPAPALRECLQGLFEIQGLRPKKKKENFEDWIYATFGKGIAKYFMLPYNFKVWATPAAKMDKQWIAERVSVIDFEKILDNVIEGKDELSWGPNNKFKFPKYGGTGGFFSAFEPIINEHLEKNKDLKKINVKNKIVNFSDGSKEAYDLLISTMPLDQLIQKSDAPTPYKTMAKKLEHNSVFVVGIGLNREIKTSKCWLYFPESNSPFYRLTYFSNYSPNNVPQSNQTALMCEISASKFKKVNPKQVVAETIQGLINTKIISAADKEKIVSKYLYKIPYAYPIPTLQRDKALRKIQPYLEKNQVYSRGRFGAWRYEIGNMDHTTMQGVEIIDRLLLGKKEKTYEEN